MVVRRVSDTPPLSFSPLPSSKIRSASVEEVPQTPTLASEGGTRGRRRQADYDEGSKPAVHKATEVFKHLLWTINPVPATKLSFELARKAWYMAFEDQDVTLVPDVETLKTVSSLNSSSSPYSPLP